MRPCWFAAACGLSMRLHNIGVRLSETKPDTSTAATMVTANLMQQPADDAAFMKMIGMKTAANDSVIDTIVKPISLAPSNVACNAGLPISIWRAMFSSMTIASSTTKPTHKVSAISDKLSRL